VSAKEGIKAEIRVYDRLFTDPHPDSGDKNFLEAINQDSKQILHAYLEPSLKNAQAEQRFQFERHGYFVADRIDHTAAKPVFNLCVGLKDTWK
jgi:glutaminyl-tRNA synthetase